MAQLKPTVYIVQRMLYRPAGSDALLVRDMSAAEKWGAVLHVFDERLKPKKENAELIKARAGEIASAFREDQDYIVPYGNPAMICAVLYALGAAGKAPTILTFNQKELTYVKIDRRIFTSSIERQPTP